MSMITQILGLLDEYRGQNVGMRVQNELRGLMQQMDEGQNVDGQFERLELLLYLTGAFNKDKRDADESMKMYNDLFVGYLKKYHPYHVRAKTQS